MNVQRSGWHGVADTSPRKTTPSAFGAAQDQSPAKEFFATVVDGHEEARVETGMDDCDMRTGADSMAYRDVSPAPSSVMDADGPTAMDDSEDCTQSQHSQLSQPEGPVLQRTHRRGSPRPASFPSTAASTLESRNRASLEEAALLYHVSAKAHQEVQAAQSVQSSPSSTPTRPPQSAHRPPQQHFSPLRAAVPQVLSSTKPPLPLGATLPGHSLLSPCSPLAPPQSHSHFLLLHRS